MVHLEEHLVAGLVPVFCRHGAVVSMPGRRDTAGRREQEPLRALVLALAHDTRSGRPVVESGAVLAFASRPTSTAALNVVHDVDTFEQVLTAGQGAGSVTLFAAVGATLGVDWAVSRDGVAGGVSGV